LAIRDRHCQQLTEQTKILNHTQTYEKCLLGAAAYAENPLNFARGERRREGDQDTLITRQLLRSLHIRRVANCSSRLYTLASQKTLDRLFELVIGLKLKTQTAAKKLARTQSERRKRHFCASLIS
jgi:hypothetical protein